MALKVIQNVSFMEGTEPITVGSHLPSELGQNYHLCTHCTDVGNKLALVLREKCFTNEDFDRIIVVLSTAYNEGESKISDRITEKGLRYIDYGLDPKKFNLLDADEQPEVLLDVVYHIFHDILARTDEQKKDVEDALNHIHAEGDHLDIVYQEKCDKNLCVKVILNLSTLGHCKMIVKLENLEGEVFEQRLLAETDSLEEALLYSGTILIRKNRVVIKPVNNVSTKHIQPLEINF